MIDVHKQAGFNMNATVQKVRKIIPSLEPRLAASVHMTLLQDRTQTIRASVRDVSSRWLITCVLVVSSSTCFSERARTLIPAVTNSAVAVRVDGRQYVLGYSLDNVSLMALTISVVHRR